MNNQGRDDAVTLEILETIARRNDVSQRHLADRLGVALGLANLYLKRCVRKGLVKIKQAPANRYLYYLTPQGFAEKSRLTAEYLAISFDFYRRAGESCVEAFNVCAANGWRRLILCGVSELGEIAFVRAEERGIAIAGTFDPFSDRALFLGRDVWRHLEQAPAFDAVLLTALSNAVPLLNVLDTHLPVDRILIPELLGVPKVGKGEHE